MSTLFQNDYTAKLIAEKNPELWRFFDNVESYSKEKPITVDSPIFQDALVLARYIFTGDTYKYRCVPGEMTTKIFEEYRDHNGEDSYYSKEHTVKLIDEATYLELRSKKETSANTESELNTLHRSFYKDEEIFAEDFLIIKAYYNALEIVTRLKNIDGFFHFVFEH